MNLFNLIRKDHHENFNTRCGDHCQRPVSANRISTENNHALRVGEERGHGDATVSDAEENERNAATDGKTPATVPTAGKHERNAATDGKNPGDD